MNEKLPKNPKHIGIIGVSSEGASLCYTTICRYGFEKFGKFFHPEITMHTFPLSRYMECIYDDNWDGVSEILLESIEKLAKVGAEVAVYPDNTVHMKFEIVKKKAVIPVLSICEVVSSECKRKGFRKVGLMGTRYTMTGKFYPDELEKHGIETVVPSKEEIEEINSIIFKELVPGKINLKTGEKLLKYTEKLKSDGCEAIILGCTELPLVLNEELCKIPVLDSPRLLALRVLEYATKT